MTHFLAPFAAIWLAAGLFNIGFLMTVADKNGYDPEAGMTLLVLVSGPFGTGIYTAEAFYPPHN